MTKRYSPKIKFQVVLELLQGDKTPAQVAKAYAVHPNTVNNWKQAFLESGSEIFAKNGAVAEYEKRIADLEQLRQIRQVIVAAGDRANVVAQLDQIELFQVAYTDFTELPYAHGHKKAYLMPILGHHCKLVYGWAVGSQANTELALQAWRRAKQTFDRLGLAYQHLILHHDQDSVYTSHAWLDQLLVADKVQLSYALDGAKDNPRMESFNSRFKAENQSLFFEAPDLAQLQAVVAAQIRYHNTQRRHSRLDYLPPLVYVKRVLATMTA